MSLFGKINKMILPAVLFCLSTNFAVSGEISPEEVKAKYLSYFPKYVKRLGSSATLSRICYYEKPGVAENMSVGQILAKSIKNSSNQGNNGLSVKWVQDTGEFSNCDILYIPAEAESNIDEILAKLGSAPILTVSATKRFIYHGGMIGFTIDDDKVKIEGSIKNMTSHSIEADAQLLNIMKNVVRD